MPKRFNLRGKEYIGLTKYSRAEKQKRMLRLKRVQSFVESELGKIMYPLPLGPGREIIRLSHGERDLAKTKVTWNFQTAIKAIQKHYKQKGEGITSIELEKRYEKANGVQITRRGRKSLVYFRYWKMSTMVHELVHVAYQRLMSLTKRNRSPLVEEILASSLSLSWLKMANTKKSVESLKSAIKEYQYQENQLKEVFKKEKESSMFLNKDRSGTRNSQIGQAFALRIYREFTPSQRQHVLRDLLYANLSSATEAMGWIENQIKNKDRVPF
jgi:hypothetical protein